MQIKKAMAIDYKKTVFVIQLIPKTKGLIFFSGEMIDRSNRDGVVLISNNDVVYKILFWSDGLIHDNYFAYDTEAEAKEKIREIFEL